FSSVIALRSFPVGRRVMVRAHRVPMTRTILLKCTVYKCFSKVEIRLQRIEGSQGESYPFNGCYSHSRRHGENRAERDPLPVATKCSESMSDSSVCGYAALRRFRDTWDGAPCPAWGSSVTAGLALRYSESVHTTQRPMPSTAGLRPAPARGVCSRGAER